MSGRGMSGPMQAETAKAANQPLHLVNVYFDDGTLHLCDAYRAVVWAGNTYIGAGYLLSFDGLEEASQVQVTTARIGLSGVDQVWISNILNKAFIDRRLAIYKGFLGVADALLVDPVLLFDGRMDAPVISEDPANGKCEVGIAATSHWVDFERRPGRHTNYEEEQIYFAGDKGFEFVSNLNRDLKWGAL